MSPTKKDRRKRVQAKAAPHRSFPTSALWLGGAALAVVAVVICIIVVGMGSDPGDSTGPSSAATPAPSSAPAPVEPQRADELIAQGYRVLDVREVSEYNAGHIAGAINVPLGQVDARLSEIDRSATWVVVCRTGVRAAAASADLAGRGYSVVTMRGGLTAWSQAGFQLVDQEGNAGHVA